MGKTTRWLKSLLGMKRDNQTPIPTADENKKNKKNKRRWSFTHSRPESAPPPRRMSLNIGDASCRRKHFPTKEEEEDNDDQAITVAAAAAEAAVAAAQAAMAVVRLANKGRSVAATTAAKERWAAIHIQNVFRGYLARKALRALKGLVKLQAHVRGYLVRKRAAATLQSMQALIRAQAAAHFLRLPPSSKEGFDESNSSKMMSDCCYEEDSPKIVEIDTSKPRSSVRPNNNGFTAQYGDRYTCPYSMSGPIEGRYLTPARLSVPSRRYDYDYDYDYEFEGGPRHNYVRQFQFRNHRRTSTAQSTPRFTDWADGPFTQAKPVWDEGPFRTFQYRQAQHPPNYMASTQSFEAKSTTRSQSAPKQRLNQPSPSKKKMPLEKLMECRRSLSGIKMNRSYSEDREAFQF